MTYTIEVTQPNGLIRVVERVTVCEIEMIQSSLQYCTFRVI